MSPHQVLAHYEDTHMTVDQLAHTLWQLIVQEFPTTIKRIASRQGKMGQLLHWWDMLERPRQWIIDSFRQTLTATIRKGLGVPAGAPQYDPRKLAIKDVRTYVQIRLTQIIRRDCLKLGRPVPWCDGFPFNLGFRHPQYVGGLLTQLGLLALAEVY